MQRKKTRILVTNDDGIDSPGIKVLESIAKKLSDDVWIVAPELEQSGKSHSITLKDPLRVRRISNRSFAVSGTPVDSVIMALNQIVGGKVPDLILAGVNRGANMAEDITYSGTVAAAMEGTFLGVPSVALSQVFKRPDSIPWNTAKKHAPPLISKLLKIGWRKDVTININFPPVQSNKVVGVEITTQGRRGYEKSVIIDRHDPRGELYYWLGFRRQIGRLGGSTDLSAVLNGAISVTPIKMNFTHQQTRKQLQAVFK